MKKEIFPFDLHVHSTISDGTFNPMEIIEIAKETGVKGLAITDHDSVGDSETYQNLISTGVCIPGLELSSINNNVHILGYGINWKNNKLQSFLKRQQVHRMNALVKMCKKTEELGIPVSVEEVMKKKNNSEGAVGRPHLASVMLEKGYVHSIKDAFNRYLRKGAPVYVLKEKHLHGFLIKKIIGWGGMPVLAHPGLIKPEIRDRIIRESIESGIMGIEAYYPSHSPEYIEQLKEIAKKNNLVITGGSDFHGTNKPHVHLGLAGLDSEQFDIFRKRLKQQTGF